MQGHQVTLEVLQHLVVPRLDEFRWNGEVGMLLDNHLRHAQHQGVKCRLGQVRDMRQATGWWQKIEFWDGMQDAFILGPDRRWKREEKLLHRMIDAQINRCVAQSVGAHQ